MMKKKIFIMLGFVTALPFFQSQKLNFKDKNLEKAVLENFDLNKNGSLEQLEADMITNLFLVQKGIASTDDLSFFKNAKMIVLDDNTIPNAFVKNLPNLQLFSCTGCKISIFKAENLNTLASLYLDNNLIENISLKDLPRIDQLTLSLNKLKSIDLIPLKNLRKLNLEHNQIQKLDISGNPQLQTLNLGGNKIKESDIKKGSAAGLTIFGTAQE
ncbi:Leucine-rich repeat (LRR) protein [Chryseobacterium sp. H1D6B]|uniref:leucine-rich repeat domain-containing protein n=1 Tax=Chryseobacterium sp. H1D6B TaxID=2940588 RepID=UPI0015CB2045|nr:leucine-rich repeat domain-containing protein [Chryseobacterium sp. H1D6B]MDH6250561.1 Leucine-rich repeat (LRR) protein [Chryseobacterium sp. H1D6B]